MISAYFDASGTEDSAMLTVGGFAANDRTCQLIAREWSVLMEGRGPFHLCDFGTEWCKLGSGSWPLARRVAFLKQLASVVNRDGVGIFSISIDTALYRSFVADSKHPEVHGSSYSQCAQLVFALVECILQRKGLVDESVAYVFESGDRKHELLKSFEEYEKKTPNLRGKRSMRFLPKDTTLLQPADLISGKVQEVLLRAHKALGCLDNGLRNTPIDRFEKYYALDGTSAPIFSQRAICWISNEKYLRQTDQMIAEVFAENPKLLKVRIKSATNQGKRRRKEFGVKNPSQSK